MRVSRKGLVAIARKEGLVIAPYLDSVKVWTWGIGHTAAAGSPVPEEMSQGMPEGSSATNDAVAMAMLTFAEDLKKYESRVRSAVKVPLQQHEFDALVSFDFNTGGIFKAKLTKYLNSGDRKSAARAFMGWLRPPEIRSRREQEMDLFSSGDYGSGGIPVYGTNGRGKITRVIKTYSSDEFLNLISSFQEKQSFVEAPDEVKELVNAAEKPWWKSTTNLTAFGGITGSVWQAWQSADTFTRVVAVIVILFFIWIVKERIRTIVRGKKAKESFQWF